MTAPAATDERTAAARRFHEAEASWHAALAAEFGPRRALDMIYAPEGRGLPGTPLRAAYDARNTARVAWNAACDAARGAQ